jgi:hypothetical protein
MRSIHVAATALVVIAPTGIETGVDSGGSNSGKRAESNEGRHETNEQNGPGNEPLGVGFGFEVLQERPLSGLAIA